MDRDPSSPMNQDQRNQPEASEGDSLASPENKGSAEAFDMKTALQHPEKAIDSFIDFLVQESAAQETGVRKKLKRSSPTYKNKRKEIFGVLKNYQEMLREGMAQIRTHDVSGNATRALEKIQHFDKSDPQIFYEQFNEEDYQSLIEIANDAYEGRQFESARSMAAVIVNLFPFMMQPYVILTSVEWQLQGIDAAVGIYENLVQTLKDPILFFYAAECFMKAKKTAKALETIEEALKMCDDNPGDFDEVKEALVDMKRQMSSGH